MKKTRRNQETGAGIGLCTGMVLGMIAGENILGSMGTGMCIGVCLGMCIGTVAGAVKDRKINEQYEQEGYTAVDIRGGDDGKSYVTVRNTAGEETVIETPAADIEAEEITAGDAVYIDEEGHIEKVEFDDEE